jgi:hypothetical protein
LSAGAGPALAIPAKRVTAANASNSLRKSDIFHSLLKVQPPLWLGQRTRSTLEVLLAEKRTTTHILSMCERYTKFTEKIIFSQINEFLDKSNVFC